MNPTSINVEKRHGELVPCDISKITQQLTWAAEGLDVSVSQVEITSHIQFYDGIKTTDIHEVLAKTAADLTSDETPDYNIMAARLVAFNIRKKAFDQFGAPHLADHIESMVNDEIYDPEMLSKWDLNELDELEQVIDHTRDFDFCYAGIKQLESKYLCQHRGTKQIFESPQLAFMCIGMALHQDEPDDTRIEHVKEFYEALSTFKISMPTPIMAGVRTPTRQFSSCVKIEVGDSLDSICEGARGIVQYASRRAGIGVNSGRIRSVDSPIRNGDVISTGKIPFMKFLTAALKSCSQGGVRGASACNFYTAWDIEFESLVILKNNKGTDTNRIHQLDECIQLNHTIYQRLIDGKDISLMCPSTYDGALYEAYFRNSDEFEVLYEKAENDPNVVKKSIKAIDMFTSIMSERLATGRIYIMNVDHCNDHSPFKETIRQSNLCLEIALPTAPVQSDGSGEIALCTLAGVNVGLVDSPIDMKKYTKIIVRALDNLLDYQNYPMVQAEATKLRRTLGVGVISLAEFIAKRGQKYSDGSANNSVHELFELFQFNLMTASVELAKEKGKCEWYDKTVMSDGILPIDTYKKAVDELHTSELKCDWEGLRNDIVTYGMRNSTLSALMPAESSALVSGSTNGVEPVKALVVTKTSKEMAVKIPVPRIKEIGDQYETLWSIQNNTGYLSIMAIAQKFICQSISSNTSYNPIHYRDKKVPMQQMLEDLIFAYRNGLKTLYYALVNDGSSSGFKKEITEKETESACGSGGCTL
jgi:ribonucleoside-diphosphate reductase alpha chain